MEQGIIDGLYADLKVDQKPGQGFKYVKTRYVLDRLNKVFNCNWGLSILEHKIIDDEVLVLVTLKVYDNDGNVLAQQEGFGSAKKFRGVELGNVFKSATSKAIKSAARNWGVGLFLEEEDYEDFDGGSTSTTTKSAMPNFTVGVPQKMDQVADAPPSGLPDMPKTGSVPCGMPTQSFAEEVNAWADANPEVKVPDNNVPKSSTPPSGGPSVLPKLTPTLGTTAAPPVMPSAASQGDGAVNTLTMVQKVAINTRLAAKGLTFEQAAEEFFANRDGDIPSSLDSMLYADALDMVTFLNSK